MSRIKELIFISKSPDDTLKLGTFIGKHLSPGDIIALTGELGSGKTQFTRGLAYGLGVSKNDYITSPSYTIINEYQGKFPLYHFDLYRLDGVEQIRELGYEEYFYGSGVCVIEWGEKFAGYFPFEHMAIEMKSREENIREFRIRGGGDHFIDLIKRVEERYELDVSGSTKIRGNLGS